MKLTSLRVRNFRNYEDMKITFDDGIHILSGKNAQGKTNLLEAILYLSTTRSHRTSKDDDLMRKGSDFFMIEGIVENGNRTFDISAYVNDRGKNLFLYRDPVHKVSEFIGAFNALLFSPDDMILFQASPKVRRRFIDVELSKLSKVYMMKLNLYYKLLKERNTYLKHSNVDMSFIQVLDEQLIDVQLIIMKQRKKMIEDMLMKATYYYVALSEDDTQISASYDTFIDTNKSEIEMKEEMKLRYQKSLERDLFTKQTQLGIHRDDIRFKVNDHDVDIFASQGQKRTYLLSLKLGILYLFYDLKKEYPVLLLDDVFSELDEDRRKKLLLCLPKEIQVFISTTEHVEIIDDRLLTYWTVENGLISKFKEDYEWKI